LEIQNTHVVELEIPPDARYVAFVRKSVRCIAESMAFSPEKAREIEISVGEAVTNSIVHGRPEDQDARITVQCRIASDALEILVEDRGRGVCVSPTNDPPVFQEHGRGYLLMNKFMERVHAHCTDRGVRVSMTKRLEPGG